MTLTRLKQKDAIGLMEVHIRYKKRLVFFASKMVDDFWAEEFAIGAIMKVWEIQDFETEESIKEFLYEKVRDECLQYLRVYEKDKKLTDQEIGQFYMKAELMQDLEDNPIK